MVYKSLKSDFFYEDRTISGLSYYVTCSGETIYTGKAYNPKGIKINIRKIVEDWLWNDMPDFRDFDGVFVEHPEAMRVFDLYTDEGTLLESYTVLLSHSEFDGTYMYLSRPIDGCADPRQKIFLDSAADNSGNTYEISTGETHEEIEVLEYVMVEQRRPSGIYSEPVVVQCTITPTTKIVIEGHVPGGWSQGDVYPLISTVYINPMRTAPNAWQKARASLLLETRYSGTYFHEGFRFWVSGSCVDYTSNYYALDKRVELRLNDDSKVGVLEQRYSPTGCLVTEAYEKGDAAKNFSYTGPVYLTLSGKIYSVTIGDTVLLPAKRGSRYGLTVSGTTEFCPLPSYAYGGFQGHVRTTAAAYDGVSFEEIWYNGTGMKGPGGTSLHNVYSKWCANINGYEEECPDSWGTMWLLNKPVITLGKDSFERGSSTSPIKYQRVVLPDTIAVIKKGWMGGWAPQNREFILEYEGTVEQFGQIQKEENWNVIRRETSTSSEEYTITSVTCSDGVYTI